MENTPTSTPIQQSTVDDRLEEKSFAESMRLASLRDAHRPAIFMPLAQTIEDADKGKRVFQPDLPPRRVETRGRGAHE